MLSVSTRSASQSHTLSQYTLPSTADQTLFSPCVLLDRYIYTSPSHLVTRLTSRSLHLLALRIATYLGMKPDAVLKHWACAKIAKSKPTSTGNGDADGNDGDEELCRKITEKFRTVGGSGVSYADIAKRAWEVGRAGLATKVSVVVFTLAALFVGCLIGLVSSLVSC